MGYIADLDWETQAEKSWMPWPYFSHQLLGGSVVDWLGLAGTVSFYPHIFQILSPYDFSILFVSQGSLHDGLGLQE